MTKRFAAFFLMAAFSFALVAGATHAGDRPSKVVSLSTMTDAEREEAMLQTGN